MSVQRISILVVNYNRLDYLKATLESVYENTEWPYELLIWDNDSTESEVKEYLARLYDESAHRHVFFGSKNIGVWRASNELIAKANSRDTLGVVKLDNDCIIKTKGWLRKWIECCQVNPEIGMMAANIEGKKERSPDTEVLELKGHSLLALLHEGTGGAVYIPGRTFKQLGFYNEEYGRYGQSDKDYARRVMTLGLKFAYHREVEIGRCAPNNDDQNGGYREHKNLYVRRNKRLYILNRYLYQKRLKSLGIWYKKFKDVVPEELLQNPCFNWSDPKPLVRWSSGKVNSHIRELLTKHKLDKVKK